VRFPLLVCSVFLALAAATDLSAQVLPVPRDDPSGDLRRFRSVALMGSQGTLNDFRTAWQAKDVRATVGLLSDDALLLLPGRESVQGRRAIEAELGSFLPEVGNVSFSLVDGDVGGSLVYVFGIFFMDRVRDQVSGSIEPETGSYTAVFQQSGRAWRIRALVFTPRDLEEEEGETEMALDE
jgi:ketosteroid isomerase-like protein